MNAIRTSARVGADGNVTVAVGVQESGRVVQVSIVPAAAEDHAAEADTNNGMPADEWWTRFNRLAGSIDDPGFVRPPQAYYEPRKVFD